MLTLVTAPSFPPLIFHMWATRLDRSKESSCLRADMGCAIGPPPPPRAKSFNQAKEALAPTAWMSDGSAVVSCRYSAQGTVVWFVQF